jgi:hypothetical protein
VIDMVYDCVRVASYSLFAQGWMDRTEEAEEKQYWAEDWDNDDLDDNFAMQLRTELTANAANVQK